MEKGDRAVITLADMDRLNQILADKGKSFEQLKKEIETEFPGNHVLRTPTGISIRDKDDLDD
jgi:hypothetical protein